MHLNVMQETIIWFVHL